MRVTNRASTRNYLRHMNNALQTKQKFRNVFPLEIGLRISETFSSGVQAMNAKNRDLRNRKASVQREFRN